MAVCNRIWIHRRRNKWLLLLGILAILLGGLWLPQGLGLVEVRPILCFADCAPVQGPSLAAASAVLFELQRI